MNITHTPPLARRAAATTRASDADLNFVVLTTVVVLTVTTLPYLYGYWSTPPDKQFMGMMLDVPDHLQYFSWMRELTTSHLAANKLTPEANPPIFFNLLWWGLGRLGAVFGLNYAGVYQVLRVLATTLFLLLSYRVCGWYFRDRLQRRTAFLTIVLTSGFGWMLILLKYTVMDGVLLFPLDVYIAEGNTLLGILGYPHFIAAALYIFVFDLFLQGQARNDLRYAVAAGLFALFLGWQHAYDLILIYGVLGAFCLLTWLRDRRFPWRAVWSCVIVGSISVWPALYSTWLTSAHPLWQAVLAQFANAGVYTPNLLHLPILLGPAFLLALYAAIRSNPLQLHGWNDRELFLQGWFWIMFILIYLPTDFQIHMLNGWQVPIAILATRTVFQYIAPFVQKRLLRRWSLSTNALQRGLAVALIVAIVPTNLYLVSWRFMDLARHDYPYYLHTDEVAALGWLEDNIHPDDVVLSSLPLGQYVPAHTGAHAFLAHWAQTVAFYTKSALVNEVYSAETEPARRQAILDQYSVDYVIYGPAERALGSYTFAQESGFVHVYSGPAVQIFAIDN